MSALDDLIARLEAAKEGSRELDCRIFELVGGVDGMFFDSAIVRFLRAHDGWYDFTTADGFHHLCAKEAPHYTTSLDAALTLVPEGWTWQVSNRAPAPHKGRAFLSNPRRRAVEDIAATPALALCIAALKARGEP